MDNISKFKKRKNLSENRWVQKFRILAGAFNTAYEEVVKEAACFTEVDVTNQHCMQAIISLEKLYLPLEKFQQFYDTPNIPFAIHFLKYQHLKQVYGAEEYVKKAIEAIRSLSSIERGTSRLYIRQCETIYKDLNSLRKVMTELSGKLKEFEQEIGLAQSRVDPKLRDIILPEGHI